LRGRIPPADDSVGAAARDLTRPAQSLDLLPVRLFVAALVALLVGYMFMGRGFAHVGVAPAYVGEVVLFGGWRDRIAIARMRPRLSVSPIVVLLLALMAWGAIAPSPISANTGWPPCATPRCGATRCSRS
jgi:hypothetical protein